MYIDFSNSGCSCSTLVAGSLDNNSIGSMSFVDRLKRAIDNFDDGDEEPGVLDHAFLYFSVVVYGSEESNQSNYGFSKAIEALRSFGALETKPQYNNKNGSTVILFVLTMDQVREILKR